MISSLSTQSKTRLLAKETQYFLFFETSTDGMQNKTAAKMNKRISDEHFSP